MSSTRRTANEVNILAMLDRHEAGGFTKRVLRALRGRPAAFWYGAAGVLAAGLVSMLAWLVRDSGTSAAVDAALAGAVTSASTEASAGHTPPPASAAPAPADAMADPASDPAPAPLADAAPDALPQGSATIVDVAPAPAVVHEPPRLAAHAAAPKAVPRPAAWKPAAAKPAAGARAPLARSETRGRRPQAPAKDAPPVDTDVALISAIIQHANKRQEAEEAARKP